MKKILAADSRARCQALAERAGLPFEEVSETEEKTLRYCVILEVLCCFHGLKLGYYCSC